MITSVQRAARLQDPHPGFVLPSPGLSLRWWEMVGGGDGERLGREMVWGRSERGAFCALLCGMMGREEGENRALGFLTHDVGQWVWAELGGTSWFSQQAELAGFVGSG